MSSRPEPVVGALSPASTETVVPAAAAPTKRPTPWWVIPAVGTVATALVVLGGWGWGDVPPGDTASNLGLQWLSAGHGLDLSRFIFRCGITIVLVCWVLLGRAAAGRPWPLRQAPLTLRQVRLTVAAWTLPLLVSVPLFSKDVYSYLAQGALFAQGLNPYVDAPIDRPGPLLDATATQWTTTTAPYSPLFIYLERGVVALTGDSPTAGMLVMRVALLPGLLLLLWAVPELARRIGAVSPARALWAVGLNPLMLLHLVGGAHADLLMAGLLAAGLVFLMRGSTLPIGVALIVLAGSIKVTAFAALPFVLWCAIATDRGFTDTDTQRHTASTRRDVAVSVLRGTAWIVALTALIFGGLTALSRLGLGWISGLQWADLIINWFTVPTLLAHAIAAVTAPFTDLGLLPILAWTRPLGYACIAVATLVIWWRTRPTAQQSEHRSVVRAVAGVAATMAVILLCEPATLPWYYSWTLVAAAAFSYHRAVIGGYVLASAFLLWVIAPNDQAFFYEPVFALKVAGGALLLALLYTGVPRHRPPWVHLRRTRRPANGASAVGSEP